MPVHTYLPTSNGITIKWERVTKSSLFFLSLEHPDSVRNSMKIFGIQTFPLQPNFTRRTHKFCEFFRSDFCWCNIACGTICGASWTRLQERPYNWIYSLRLLLMQYCSTICGASWTKLQVRPAIRLTAATELNWTRKPGGDSKCSTTFTR